MSKNKGSRKSSLSKPYGNNNYRQDPLMVAKISVRKFDEKQKSPSISPAYLLIIKEKYKSGETWHTSL